MSPHNIGLNDKMTKNYQMSSNSHFIFSSGLILAYCNMYSGNSLNFNQLQ